MSDLAAASRGGWLDRLKAGLGRSAKALGDGIGAIFTNRKLDAAAIEELEELLIAADLGTACAARFSANLAATKFDKDVTPGEVQSALAADIATLLEPLAVPLIPDPANTPHVVLVVGVNGTGKTTTIGKLAKQWSGQGLKVMLAAADTFRAAAVEQLQVWGARSGAPVVTGKAGGDPAGLAYDALDRARNEACDVLIIDTAGRLQNKADLMEELAKLVRVVKKLDASAPHSVVLVLDATVGQNAHRQVEVFRDIADLTGLIVTKLDGSARGGVVVALAERFGLPVHAVGVGEGIDDLRPFEAENFSKNLLGLET